MHNYYHHALHGAPILWAARVGDRRPEPARILATGRGTSKSTDAKENLQSARQKAETFTRRLVRVVIARNGSRCARVQAPLLARWPL